MEVSCFTSWQYCRTYCLDFLTSSTITGMRGANKAGVSPPQRSYDVRYQVYKITHLAFQNAAISSSHKRVTSKQEEESVCIFECRSVWLRRLSREAHHEPEGVLRAQRNMSGRHVAAGVLAPRRAPRRAAGGRPLRLRATGG